ncbi:hypothetical protein DPMN_167539 [Dreissena polymorpha]|uniref:Uncharacterized protein n=1 Tax=Dreissena polymorpha TaxID=45954 RepID=A0A9D4F0Z1_DREPO|nr:hypothetical protein DPMN_167539 [Dreissena polymorpha]
MQTSINEEVFRGAQGLVMGPCMYQFEVNGCSNKELNPHQNPHNFSPKGQIKIPKSALSHIQYTHGYHVCKFQGSSANSVGGNNGQDGRTDGGDNHIIDSKS